MVVVVLRVGLISGRTFSAQVVAEAACMASFADDLKVIR